MWGLKTLVDCSQGAQVWILTINCPDIRVYIPDSSQGQDVRDLSDSVVGNTWNTPACVWMCVWRGCGVISAPLTHEEWKHVACLRGKGGLSVSVSISCFLLHTSPELCTLSNWDIFPPAPTPSFNLPLDLSPLSVPSPHPILSVLHWKGERMLSPHKSQSLLVLQEQGSCHWEAPASLTQKTE